MLGDGAATRRADRELVEFVEIPGQMTVDDCIAVASQPAQEDRSDEETAQTTH